ncbi:MAG: endonuclease III [Gemmatimonadota bacterium]|nr:endonuclease III [Gemmatimonadota bacterium]
MTGRGPSAASVRARLTDRYGTVDKPTLDPLDELVLTILSQSTTDANRDRAYDRLRDRFPSWDDVRTAPGGAIEDAVRVAGLGGQKARSIKRALARLHEERGSTTLSHLAAMGDTEATEYLTSFDGVGVKTAACVLCFSLRRPVLPVDTHVFRIGKRLGWLPESCTANRAHRLLEEWVQPSDRFAVHMLLITLGRDACTARAPSCGTCPVEQECPKIGLDAGADRPS